MAIYVISDLHLSFGVHKPMDVFGNKWKGYEEKIKEDWQKKVKAEDDVILAGDFSWATYLEEATEDFAFLASLPGRKILLKGNHDYWWETVTKMNHFLEENHFENIFFLYNNCIETKEAILCGTRYWALEEVAENDKIFHREIERAKFSLREAEKLNQKREEAGEERKPVIMVTHYPPDALLLKELKEFKIELWIYAHIHSNYEESKVEITGIPSYLTSCDYMDFQLKRVDLNGKM